MGAKGLEHFAGPAADVRARARFGVGRVAVHGGGCLLLVGVPVHDC